MYLVYRKLQKKYFLKEVFNTSQREMELYPVTSVYKRVADASIIFLVNVFSRCAILLKLILLNQSFFNKLQTFLFKYELMGLFFIQIST